MRVQSKVHCNNFKPANMNTDEISIDDNETVTPNPIHFDHCDFKRKLKLLDLSLNVKITVPNIPRKESVCLVVSGNGGGGEGGVGGLGGWGERWDLCWGSSSPALVPLVKHNGMDIQSKMLKFEFGKEQL